MKLFKEENKLETGSVSSFSLSESTRNNTIQSSLEGKIIRLNYKSKNFIFPMLYFLTSTLFLFMLLCVSITKEHQTIKNLEHFSMHPFPSFSTFKKNYKNIFYALIFLISISGISNIWFFCSLLLQRFSVPELKSNKLTVHLMFILGSLANLIFIFFGFTPEILLFEHSKIRVLRISISMIIFISFIFFNLLISTLTLNVLMNFKQQIAYNDKRLKRNIKGKKGLVYLALFLLVLYFFAILMRYTMAVQSNKSLKEQNKLKRNKPKGSKETENAGSSISFETGKQESFITRSKQKISNQAASGFSFFEGRSFAGAKDKFFAYLKNFVDAILFLFPYLLFFFNSLINLSYYFDIVYLEDIINLVIEREFFLENDETSKFLSDLPI